MNKAILMGRLTKDPELRMVKDSISVCSFTIAVDRKYKNANGVREADFIPIVCWRATADFVAKYFKKGQRIAVVGSLQVRSWEDADGKRNYITEVVADEVFFADSKQGGYDNASSGRAPSSASSVSSAPSVSEDDLPFSMKDAVPSVPRKENKEGSAFEKAAQNALSQKSEEDSILDDIFGG